MTQNERVSGADTTGGADDAAALPQAAGTTYFRANSGLADASATGSDAIAVGPKAVAAGPANLAVGTGAEDPSNHNANAHWTQANARYAVAIGASAISNAKAATALGHEAYAPADDSLAVGARMPFPTGPLSWAPLA